MLNVLHHIHQPRLFLNEACRCLKNGGELILIEPANTLFSRFIYTHIHHEGFYPSAENWELSADTPLSCANGALPWIIFVRDQDCFKAEFPALQLYDITVHTPLSYLLSGGLSFQQLVPNRSYTFIRKLERLSNSINRLAGLFMTVRLKKLHVE